MKNYKHIKVDLSNCDKEPIEIIGRIQSHGFLMVLNSNFLIEQISDNISLLSGYPIDSFLNQNLESVLTPQEHRKIIDFVTNQFSDPFIFTLNNRNFYGYIYRSKDKIVIEAEPILASNDFENLHSHSVLKEVISRFQNHYDLNSLSNILAVEIQKITRYDRVMIYKFDADWHGHVIAEKVKPAVHSYFNHHFPASDIPEQARKMLYEKRVRQIPDVNHTGSDITPYINPSSNEPTNLIKSELRNPSEIHLEYLKNMDVKATLSIAIVVNNKLWGLVACQHESPLFIDFPKRNICELIVRFYENGIVCSKEKADEAIFGKFREVEKALVHQMEEGLDVAKALFHRSVNILDITEATGATLAMDGKLVSIGVTPKEEQITQILKWGSKTALPEIYETREFSREFPEASQYKDVASGILIVEISRHAQEYLLLFKPETKIEISWAGDPKSSKFQDSELKLHPRKSFQKYTQIVEGKSSSWSVSEIEVIKSLRKSMISIHLKCQAEKLKKMNHTLGLQNSQLSDFTYIASHNLLSPLNTIQALLSLNRHGKLPSGDTLEKVETVASNMKQTLDDLHLLLKVSAPNEIEKTEVAIDEIISKEKENLYSQITLSKTQVITDLKVKQVIYVRSYLESLFHNLISNAIKYRAIEGDPYVLIKTYKSEGRIIIEVSDNGLGIDLVKNKEKVFGLYKTFHINKDSRGLGLYLIKKQTESLGGSIEVESKVGVGTTFKVYLGS